MKNLFFAFLLVAVATSCSNKKQADKKDMWGATTEQKSSGSTLQLDDLVRNGELILATLSGPQTYYEYHGQPVGLHYLLCNEFCKKLGVSVRVEVCKDSSEVYKLLRDGEADLSAMPFHATPEGLGSCGGKGSGGTWHWLVNKENTTLADSIDAWLTAKVVSQVAAEESSFLAGGGVKRHVYSPFLDRGRGVISSYDPFFQKYAGVAGVDWRLLAAQCYQESTFDPHAHSWAGACGLMQIMPYTASEMGLSVSNIYDPEQNISTAARYMAHLDGMFSDVSPKSERIKFVLASYNGGSFHVRDAMALARKYGRSPYRWSDVREFILRLSQPAYYNDPVVKSGYMRGAETFSYVESIFARWMDYRGGHYTPARPVDQNGSSFNHIPSGSNHQPAAVDPATPHPSNKGKQKYAL